MTEAAANPRPSPGPEEQARVLAVLEQLARGKRDENALKTAGLHFDAEPEVAWLLALDLRDPQNGVWGAMTPSARKGFDEDEFCSGQGPLSLSFSGVPTRVQSLSTKQVAGGKQFVFALWRFKWNRVGSSVCVRCVLKNQKIVEYKLGLKEAPPFHMPPGLMMSVNWDDGQPCPLQVIFKPTRTIALRTRLMKAAAGAAPHPEFALITVPRIRGLDTAGLATCINWRHWAEGAATLRRVPTAGHGQEMYTVAWGELESVLITHEFDACEVALMRTGESVPPHWHKVPFKPLPAEAKKALTRDEHGDFAAMAAALKPHDMLRKTGETKWAYAQRFVTWLMRHVKYDLAKAMELNSGKPPSHIISTSRVAQCGSFTGVACEVFRMAGIPAFSTCGFGVREERASVAGTALHCVMTAWFDGLGWLPVEPQAVNDPQAWPFFGGWGGWTVDQAMALFIYGDRSQGYFRDAVQTFPIRGGTGYVESLFHKLDADKSGKLSSDELAQLLQREVSGSNPQSDTGLASSIMAKIDKNKDGEVDLAEFLAFLRSGSSSMYYDMVAMKPGQTTVQVFGLTKPLQYVQYAEYMEQHARGCVTLFKKLGATYPELEPSRLAACKRPVILEHTLCMHFDIPLPMARKLAVDALAKYKTLDPMAALRPVGPELMRKAQETTEQSLKNQRLHALKIYLTALLSGDVSRIFALFSQPMQEALGGDDQERRAGNVRMGGPFNPFAPMPGSVLGHIEVEDLLGTPILHGYSLKDGQLYPFAMAVVVGDDSLVWGLDYRPQKDWSAANKSTPRTTPKELFGADFDPRAKN